MRKIALKYGLICGPFFLLILFWTYYVGNNPFSPSLWIIDLLIFGLFMFFAGYELKNLKQNGIFHFWQGMSIGAIVIVSSTLVFGVGLFIWLEMDEALMNLYIDKALETYESNKDLFGEGFSEKDVRNRTTLGLTLQMAVQNNLLSGFVIAPVVAIILRKKPT